MSLKTREILSFYKSKLEEITPNIGRIHSTLRASAKPEDVITDFKFKDESGRKELKFYILKPGPRTAERSTIGGSKGFYLDLRAIVIQCFISMATENPDAADARLEDVVDLIVDKLFSIDRLSEESGDNTFSPGDVAVTPIVVGKVSNTSVLIQEITTIVGDRRIPGG